MNYGTRVFTVLLVVSLLIFAVLTNTTVIYAQKVAINTQQTPSPSVPKLHSIKITSPTKGQEVPIDKELTVSGVYTPGNATITTTHCQVSVIANGVKPYQPATGIGPGGAADFSKWNFVLSSNYTTIKQGPNNKITAKYTCSNNPGLASFNSVNITGVATTAKQQQGQQNVSNTTYKNTIPIQQTTHVVSNNTRSAILPYLISKNASQVTSTKFLGNGGTGNLSGMEYLGYPDAANASQVITSTFLGNGGTGKVSGMEYLGYPDAANANQVTSLGNGGTGKVSGMEYLGSPGHRSGSSNYNPVATGGRESGSSRDNVGPGSDDSSISTNHPHKAKSPRGVYQSPTSRSYIGGSGSDGPTQQSSTITMGNNTTIDALFPIENDNKNAAALARTGGGSTEFGFNFRIFPSN
jgi:hypothetical protein